MVVRIVGAAVDRIVRLPIRQIGRDIGLAEDDRTRCFQLRDHACIAPRDVSDMRLVSPAGRQALDVETFLDRHRHAEQRLIGLRTLDGHRAGAVQRAIEIRHHHRIDMRIEVLDPRNRRLDRFERCHLGPADRGRGFDGTGFVRQRGIGHAVSSIAANVG